MAGYIIVQVDIKDPETYDTYRKQVLPTIEAHGGQFLARGGALEILEGEWPWPRVVVIQFPSVEAAKAWYHSDAYQPLAAMRQSASVGNMIVVEGA
ncbi:MAG: DUF1330 domain-containing protein [Alphaproteobacteria bacterium]|nr:DUF1330 domain-containing protein [Alphaproteobacteria bacterium]